MPDPITEELRLEQIDRKEVERERARDATEPGETEQHERRAEKADYLRDKLAERGRSEDEAERED